MVDSATYWEICQKSSIKYDIFKHEMSSDKEEKKKKNPHDQKLIIFCFNLTQLPNETKRFSHGSDVVVCGWPGVCW